MCCGDAFVLKHAKSNTAGGLAYCTLLRCGPPLSRRHYVDLAAWRHQLSWLATSLSRLAHAMLALSEQDLGVLQPGGAPWAAAEPQVRTALATKLANAVALSAHLVARDQLARLPRGPKAEQADRWDRQGLH